MLPTLAERIAAGALARSWKLGFVVLCSTDLVKSEISPKQKKRWLQLESHPLNQGVSRFPLRESATPKVRGIGIAMEWIPKGEARVGANGGQNLAANGQLPLPTKCGLRQAVGFRIELTAHMRDRKSQRTCQFAAGPM